MPCEVVGMEEIATPEETDELETRAVIPVFHPVKKLFCFPLLSV